MMPPFAAVEAALEEILPMREAYRREMDAQIVHDSWHSRGFARPWLLFAGGEAVGYGAVGGAPREPKDIVKEFHVIPERRGDAVALFRALVAASGARRVAAQTNDVLLLLMLHDFATEISSDTILFADRLTTNLEPPVAGTVFRALAEADRERAFTHTHEPVGEWGLDLDGSIIATGGLALHYNPPYADIYMEVVASQHRRGLGSYLVQELKRVARQEGYRAAARCHKDNTASRRALERAGMLPCARIVEGRLAPAG